MEKSKDLEERRYVYHIGSAVYDSIKPLALQEGGMDRLPNGKVGETYIHEINAFLTSIEAKHVKKLVSKGFSAWDIVPMYMYKIDLLHNDNAIEYIRIVSTKEENDYHEKNYVASEYHKDPKGYMEKYKSDMREELKDVGVRNELTLDEYMELDIKRFREWKNMDKWIHVNLLKGNKQQYASNIPHAQIYVTKPLKILEITKLKV